MPAKKHTLTDEEQYRRFVAKARELGCDESPEAFDRAFKKVVPAKRGSSAKEANKSR